MDEVGGHHEYEFTAEYYDAVVPYRERADVDFYVGLARGRRADARTWLRHRPRADPHCPRRLRNRWAGRSRVHAEALPGEACGGAG